MRRILYLIFYFCAIISAAGTPSWESPTLHNGQLRVDGQLYKRFSLGRLGGSPEFAFPLYLEHNISKYPYNEYERFSQWTVPQLTSYVTPINGGVFWLSPGGEEYFFRGEDTSCPLLTTRPAKLKTSYVAVQSSNKDEPDRIYIISKDRFVYAYDKGILASLEAPSGRRLYFKTNGIRITDIEQRIGSTTIPLMSAKYDGLNRLTELSIGPVFHKFSYDGDSEIMTEWKPFNINERKMQFIYRNGLVSKIKYANGYMENFSWAASLSDFELSGKHYLDNMKFMPVLLSDSENMYTFGQEKEGILMQKENLLGNSDKLIFNPVTNKLTSIDKGGVTSSVQWGRGFQNEATGKLSEITSPKGEALVKLKYDSEGRISEMIKRGEMPIKYTYDNLDRITEIQNGDYPPTKYTYDKESMRPTKITNSLGETIEFSYGSDQQITSYKNADKAQQHFFYDEVGRLKRRNYPMGVWISWAYDKFGRVIAREYSNGNSIKYEYDANNQTKRVVENGNVTWEYTYHPSGRIAAITRNKKPWLEVSSEIRDEKEYLSIINNKGAEQNKIFTLDGRLLEEINPLKETIQYKYDPIGQLTGWVAPDGSDVKFEYDARGKMIFHENSIGQTIENTYDEFGNFIEKKTKEQTTKLEYDKYDRVIKRDFSNGDITEIKYDNYGRITEMLSGGVKIEIGYDALGRQTKRIVTYSDGAQSATIISYNKIGLREKIITAIQRSDKTEDERSITEYKYDALGRAIEVTVNNTTKITYIYDKKSQMLQSKVFSTGSKSVYGYNDSFRLKSIKSYNSTGGMTGAVEYEWDDDGTLLGKKVW